MKIVILDDEGKVVKEATDLKLEDISLVGISMWRGAEEMGNQGKIEGVLNTFREATVELTDRSFLVELEEKRRTESGIKSN